MILALLNWFVPVAHAAADPDVASSTNYFMGSLKDNVIAGLSGGWGYVAAIVAIIAVIVVLKRLMFSRR